MRLKKFLINGAFLTAAAFITQVLGMIFRAYMSSRIGAEALGLYQLIVTVYAFAVTVSASGITLLVTRAVTEAAALKNEGCIKCIVSKCMSISLAASIITGLLLFLLSGFISQNILRQKSAEQALKILSLSLPFIAISACIRGYFYAVRQAFKTAIEQLIEQITEFAVFAAVTGISAPAELGDACSAAALGAVASEAVTAVYSFVLYRLDIKRYKPFCGTYKIKNKFFSIALPVTLSSCLRSGLSVIEHSTIPASLERYGHSKQNALHSYGIVIGMVMPLLSFPAIVIFSFASLIIPEISDVYARTDKKRIQYITSRAIKTVLVFSIPVACIFFFFGNELGMLVYQNESAGVYLRIFAFTAPLMYLDKIVDGILKGLNEQLHYLAYNIMDSFIRVILVIILVPRFGIAGIIITVYVSSIFNTGLSLLRLIKVTEIKIKVLWITAPLIISILILFFIRNIPFFK